MDTEPWPQQESDMGEVGPGLLCSCFLSPLCPHVQATHNGVGVFVVQTSHLPGAGQKEVRKP